MCFLIIFRSLVPNLLTRLVITVKPNVKELSIMNVTNLCIYSNPKLIKLSIDNLIKLKVVSIRDNIELKELTSSSNSITELDILGVPKLKTLLTLPLLLTKLEISSEK